MSTSTLDTLLEEIALPERDEGEPVARVVRDEPAFAEHFDGISEILAPWNPC